MTEIAVLWHAGCPDGWTAAWAAHHALTRQNDVSPALIPVSYGQPAPDLTAYRLIYMVDFAYPHDTILEIVDSGPNVLVLDHHRTAIDNIAEHRAPQTVIDGRGPNELHLGDGPYSVVLDVNRSGAGIVWDFFHTERGSALVDYVEDRDLWRHWLPQSKEINAYIHTQPVGDIEAWDRLAALLATEDGLQQAATSGEGAMAMRDAYCRATAEEAHWCDMGGRVFPIVNAGPFHRSDVAGHLLDVFETNMAGYWYEDVDGMTRYGFRSRGGVDVEQFVKQFGGGGHPQAAGCQTDGPVHKIVRGGTEGDHDE